MAVAVSGNILRTPHFAEPFVVLLIGQLLPYSFYLFEDIIATEIPCNFVFLAHLGGSNLVLINRLNFSRVDA